MASFAVLVLQLWREQHAAVQGRKRPCEQGCRNALKSALQYLQCCCQALGQGNVAEESPGPHQGEFRTHEVLRTSFLSLCSLAR